MSTLRMSTIVPLIRNVAYSLASQRDAALLKSSKAETLLKKADERRLRAEDERKRLAEQLSASQATCTAAQENV